MTNDTLYREELMEVYKNPRHRGHVQNATVDVSGKNPMCGDELELQLQIEDGVIKDAKFDGSACAVSIISSTYLLDYLIGKPVEVIREIDKEKLLELIGLNLTTSRVKCATLILDAAKNALEQYGKRTN